MYTTPLRYVRLDPVSCMPPKTRAASPDSARRRYERLVERFSRRGVQRNEEKGFGGAALTVGGKMFATLSSRGRLVVKLPRERVASLVASNDGRPFEPGPGRVMKEWLELDPDSRKQWSKLADEAYTFVGQL